MKIAIVDDLKSDRDILNEKLNQYAKCNNIKYELTDFSSAEEFLEDFEVGKFQIVFLDIYMDKITGMDAAKQIFKTDSLCKIIFLTTSEEFARQSYSVNAVYYLIKPIEDEEFLHAMELCKLKPDYNVPMISIKKNGSVHSIETELIYYIDVYQHTTRIHLYNNVIELYTNFSEFIAPLKSDRRFSVCSRGIMVNFQHVKDIENDCFMMNNGEAVLISRRNKRNIQEQWYGYTYNSLGDKL